MSNLHISDKRTFGEMLRDNRIERKLTIKNLANILEYEGKKVITEEALRKVEIGETKPRPELALAVASWLGINRKKMLRFALADTYRRVNNKWEPYFE